METGTLNERIEIYRPKADCNLTSLDDYELLTKVWSNVRNVTTREQLRSGIEIQSGQITILIRFIKGLSDDCIVKWCGNYYAIDNLSADKHKGEILLGCSYRNENQRLTT